VVAQSGDRKTPGLKVLLRALDRIEKENSPQYREAHRAHQMREAVNANPPRDRYGIWPALYVQDATIQRLAKLCEARPRGMMQISAEGHCLPADEVGPREPAVDRPACPRSELRRSSPGSI
jgi:hypothetical protein